MVTKYLYDTTDVCGLNGYNESSAFEENQFQQSFTRCTLIDIKIVSQNTALYDIYEVFRNIPSGYKSGKLYQEFIPLYFGHRSR